MADEFKKTMHKRVGVGGLKCDCCNKYNGKKRKVLNRQARRVSKQPTRFLVENAKIQQ